MFRWLRLKFVFIRFCDLFEAIWGSIWHHFSEKNPSENRFKKRGPPTWKCLRIPVSDGSQRRRLLLFFIKAAASRARWIQFNSIQFKLNSIQIQFKSSSNWKWLFELASKSKKSLEIADWVWFQLEKFRKQFEKLERADVRNVADVKMAKAHYWWSDTLVGQGPANFQERESSNIK